MDNKVLAAGLDNGRQATGALFLEFAHQSTTGLQIFAEAQFLTGAVLQALQVFLQKRIRFLAYPVDHPLGAALRFHQATLPHEKKVLGNLHLLYLQDFHQMADAQRALPQQVEDSQPLPVAQAFVDGNYIHVHVYS